MSGDGPAGTLPHDSLRRRFAGPLLRLRQSFPFLYFTDDGGPLYRRSAYREAVRLIETEGIGTIFSSFRPWSDHLVARKLKKRFPQLRWIADFRDIHADPVRKDVWWPALQRWWARRMIASADEVWGVSEGQVGHLREIYPAPIIRRNRLTGLPPATTAPPSERFTILYTGSLYDRLQSVEPLVSALNELVAAGQIDPRKVELIYRGKDNVLWDLWLATLHKEIHRDTQTYVAPAIAQSMQHAAQVLLLLNWSAQNYYGVLTAKLYEYLYAGRPILALVNGPADPELSELVELTGAGRVFAAREPVTEWLLEHYRKWRDNGGKLAWSPNLSHLRVYLEDWQFRPAPTQD
ncbi:hypothetical protein [Lewinella sp. JB7]|uniref:hypothetical protein n=1 Tax=Lewinella sp. JB7 TaxID=2962887 RepID=UPI0020C979DA|nr:hypothetical protein [Lewinella sp. JB7]MCP9236764.1 hypothetical protein [Lewinella sp. JB7]